MRDEERIQFELIQEYTAKIENRNWKPKWGRHEVEYGGQIWKLPPLVYKLYEQRGELNASGAFAGADYFKYSGKKLRDLPDIGIFQKDS